MYKVIWLALNIALNCLNIIEWMTYVADAVVVKVNPLQKQPCRGDLSKRSLERMQQIYRRTLMPKCDFNKVKISSLTVFLPIHLIKTF